MRFFGGITLKRIWPVVVLAGITSASGGCPSPASPPTPPAEIPALIVFPQSVTIDVGAISSSGGGSAAALTASGEFAETIFIGGDLARSIQEEVLEGLLSIFHFFEIPVDPRVTNFTGHREFDDGGLPQDIKFDFSDFDFDGDGATEGCTGCTCPVGCALESCPKEAPLSDLKRVCFRVWIKNDPTEGFARAMAGFFDLLPIRDDPATPEDEENPGKGRFHGGVVNQGGSIDGEFGSERFLVGVVYDHRRPDRPQDKSTRAFLINDFELNGELAFSNNLHAVINQIGKTDASGKDYAEKTVKSAERFTGTGDSGTPNDFFQRYVGRFRDDADFWNGSVFARDQGVVTRNIQATCAQISTGNASAAANCSDLGIDTTGETFINPAVDADVVFPVDFPALPGF